MSKDVVASYKSIAGELLLNPNDAIALTNQMSLLSENSGERKLNGHYAALARRAYTLTHAYQPTFNYAGALHRAGDYAKARALYEDCLALASTPRQRARALHHIGICYRAMHDDRNSIAFYEQALELEPENKLNIVQDKALALLAGGELRKGLELFEVRHDLALEKMRKNEGVTLGTQAHLPPGTPWWNGEDLTGKRVVVLHEEGTGDFIMWCRFIPLLRSRLHAKEVFLTGPTADLLDLVSDQIDIDGILPINKPFDVDYVVGSHSTPWRCGCEYSDVSGAAYFKAEPATFPLRGELNVGLAWRGNPAYAHDGNRSMALTELSSLFDMTQCAFYSLQVGDGAQEITHHGYDGFLADLAPFAKNWRATAGLITRLDAIVSVDTAVAHLAGALGKPVFVLVTKACDWRWNPHQERTCWYDSMRIYRQQTQGDWRSALKRARRGLEQLNVGTARSASCQSKARRPAAQRRSVPGNDRPAQRTIGASGL